MSTPSKEDELRPFSTRLPNSLIKRMKAHCIDKETSVQEWLAQQIEKGLKEKR
jgi:hypothetical protein